MISMLTALIVDDERACRESLKNLLELYCTDSVKVIGLAASVDQARNWLHSNDPHLVFLDISLPPTDGFELLESIKNPDTQVIFTTAYSEYAIKALRARALDYLLKPIDTEELQHAVSNAGLNAANRSSRKPPLTKIPVPVGGSSVVLPLHDIIRIEASLKKTNIILRDKSKLLSLRNIGEFEEMLQESNFFRVHREHLININEVKEHIPGRNGGWVVMTDGKLIPIAARRKKEFGIFLGL